VDVSGCALRKAREADSILPCLWFVNKDRLRTQISVSGHDLTGLLQLNIDIQKTRLVGNKTAFSAYIYV